MKISSSKYYLIITVLFFAISYFLSGTKELLQTPIFYMIAGPFALFIRFYNSIFELSDILKQRHKIVFEQHELYFVIGWRGKVVNPLCIFSKSVNEINDNEIKQILNRAKENLLFTIVSFVTLPLAIYLIMSLR